MTSLAPSPLHHPPSLLTHRTADDERVLDDIHHADVDIAAWTRGLPDGLEEELDAWTRSVRPRVDTVVATRGADLRRTLADLPGGPARDMLEADLRHLLARFGQLAETEHASLRFGIIADDRCRKFHVDRVALRLVTTYVGPGTEWLPELAVQRGAMICPPDCPHDANNAIVANRTLIEHARPGDVVLLKGLSYGPHARGAVHRSPPLAPGQVRLVLILTVDERARS